MWITRKILTTLLDVCFPTHCFICNTKGKTICKDCAHACARAVDIPIQKCFSYYSYRDPTIRLLIHQSKYHTQKDLVRDMISHINKEEILSWLGEGTETIIVPIPMPAVRKWSRGYNHAQIVAQYFSEHLAIPINSTLLIRAKETPQQAIATTRNERERSIRTAFKVGKGEQNIKTHQTILLVDDIVTTGATLSEARKTLEKAGFKDIRALTLAH